MFKKRIKKQNKKPKSTWRKIWYFIWEDDSLLSWIVNIVIAFILIKFVVYPGLGFVLGTTHPVVAVVSGSMEHKTTHPCVSYNPENGRRVCTKYDTKEYQICGKSFDKKQKVDFDNFWEFCGDYYREFNINKLKFEKYMFKNGFNTGDIIVLLGKKPSSIKIGDVIVFRGREADPIIHRVIRKWETNGEYHFQTKGDHNAKSYIDFEADINESQLVGKAMFKIPFLGNIKIWFVDLLRLIKLDGIIGGLFN